MPTRTCPDCSVTLQRVDYSAGPHNESIRIDDPDADGLLGVVGGNAYLDAYLCGECGLVRFYAD
ncbi:hypothetical protein [Haloglomus halophilum]|uniref:hypothetical protein n=1 Tax=Haloglomus halophilum TaxID=2962672 RepID=UPI0020CA1BCF|nr:hypothetical protein [Haloglomus halophilum]